MRGAHKAGFVAIIGRPNVGKSTLMNRMVGQKVSIISPRPQTTRNRILGIKSRPEGQIVFVDTPGIHRATALFNREMVRTALKAAEDADLILWMIEATDPDSDEDHFILENLRAARPAMILAINKVDLIQKDLLLPMIERYAALLPFAEIVPISATEGDNVDRLEELLVKHLPEGQPFYPEEQLTDRPERFLYGEIIREKIFHLTHQEVPYGVAVEVEGVTEREETGVLEVRATIYVEKDSQKAIVIGAGGGMLKRIGELARKEIEGLAGRKVYLGLWVKVAEAWRRDAAALRRFGYLQS